MTAIKNKWWIRTIREQNYFGFRYWWFNYLILFIAVLLFCLSPNLFWKNDENCLKKYHLTKKVYDIEKALELCCTCDLPPRAPEDTFAIDCPDRVLAFQVCNSNSAVDDNFYVYLNGTKIGELDLNKAAKVGSVFLATYDNNITIKDADFVCPILDMKLYYFDPKLLKYGNNVIVMKNVQSNNNSNEGKIEIRNYLITGNELSAPCKIKDLVFTGNSGIDFTIDFTYTKCCE